MLVYIASCRLFYRAIICRLFVSWVLNNFPRDFIKGVQWSNYKVECVSCATSPLCNYPPPDIPTWPIFSPSPMPVHCVTNLIYHHCCFHRYLIYHHYLSPLLLSPIHHAQHRPTRFTHCRRRPLASLLLWMGCLHSNFQVDLLHPETWKMLSSKASPRLLVIILMRDCQEPYIYIKKSKGSGKFKRILKSVREFSFWPFPPWPARERETATPPKKPPGATFCVSGSSVCCSGDNEDRKTGSQTTACLNMGQPLVV